MTLLKKNYLFIAFSISVLLCILLFSCQKELSTSGVDLPGNSTTDLSTRINTSVDGFVTDENEVSVEGAIVQAGSASTTTDKFGYFKFTDVSLVKNAAFVTVIKPGYFKGIKTFIAKQGHGVFFRIKLLPKNIVGSINAASGGAVTLLDGLSVTLPAAGVVNASNNSSYSGTVNVSMKWISPVAADLNRIMPGDLRGINTSGAVKLLTTYGMSAVELTGESGEKLQIAAGKKAILSFPLPTSVAGSAPSSIPLWYFDEAVGLWKEEGSAVKTGNNFIGEVSHFSYWNCDVPLENSVGFDFTLKDNDGNPIPNANVSVRYSGGDYTGAHGYTDSSGYVNGRLPANSQLVIEVYPSNCNNMAFTQNISTGIADLSLGNIVIGVNVIAEVKGNVNDCNNMAVTKGYVVFQTDFYNQVIPILPDGSFKSNVLLCGSNTAVFNVIPVDATTQQQGTSTPTSISAGNNDLGILTACGTSIEEYINYNINGTDYSMSAPAATISSNGESTFEFISASFQNRLTNLSFGGNPMGVGSSQNIVWFSTSDIPDSVQMLTPINVTITEYGAVGEFISGNFTGTFTGAPPANTPYLVTCNFRVKRKN